MGVLAAGEHTFEWDGEDEAGIFQQPGAYGFEVIATDTLGERVPVAPMIRGLVTRINLEDAVPMLYVGDIPVSLSSVVDIQVPEDPQEPAGDGE